MVKKINLSGGSSEKKVFKPLTAGVQEARILRLVDLGEQPPFPGSKFQTGPKRQLLVSFEMADDTVEIDGEVLPATAHLRVNLVGGEKAKLTKLAKAAGLGDKGSLNLEDFIGKALSLTIENKQGQDGTERSYVRDFSGLSARVAAGVPELKGEGFLFDYDDPDLAILQKLSKGIKETLAKAVNFPGSEVEKALERLDTDVKQNKVVTEDDLDNDVI